MSKTVSPLGVDGEIIGSLRRPIGGFQVVGCELVPRGRAITPATWPTSSYPWLRSFADLATQTDGAIAAFASKYGWLRRPLPLVGPDLSEAVDTWRSEAARLRELVRLLDAGQRLSKTPQERDRRLVLEHFTTTDGAAMWKVQGQVRALGFAYVTLDDVEIHWLPADVVPGAQALSPGSNPQVAPTDALSSLALYAVGLMAASQIYQHTVGGLMLSGGLRVMPRNLLGALYLNLARHRFGRSTWRVCGQCRDAFFPSRRDQVWCGEACKQRAKRGRAKAKGWAAVAGETMPIKTERSATRRAT